MRLVRFRSGDRIAAGVVEGAAVIELPRGLFGPLEPRGPMHDLSAVTLLAPCAPSKVVAVGLNYRDHAAELGFAVPDEPVLFLKPPTTVIGPKEAIVHPAMSGQVDYEAELAVVIGRRIRRIGPAEAASHILGYTCANDVTARDLQKKDGQWTRAKSFDTFCPLGPWIETGLDPGDLSVESYLNGSRRQSSRTSQFVFPIDRLVSFISRVMTLEAGDVVITGTPSGIGPMLPGDTIEVRIEGIGNLKNKVIAE
jgi:2-keto-4-pentenoate hydratase/2-oxohepta-3-ene-1,7-dioic acid hydratase in catechol pathway